MATIKVVFTYTGANQTFTIPQNVSTISIKSWGAGGGQGTGDSFGGPGGYAFGNLAVTASQTLTVIVGSGGYPHSNTIPFGGGGAGGTDTSGNNQHGSSGGGRSAIRLSNGTEVLTAGGGGGSGFDVDPPAWSNGGSGGGLIGIDGWIDTDGENTVPGKGGTQVAGGAGGIYYKNVPLANGLAGSAFQGGQGGQCSELDSGGGGGGGGGRFGGGGGSGQYTKDQNPHSAEGAGGGGSSYIGGVTGGITLNTPQNNIDLFPNTLVNPPNTTDVDYAQGIGVGGTLPNSFGGNGRIVISYEDPILAMVKSASSNFIDLNSNLIYTISITNNTGVTATNVRFIDTIPSGTTFVANSLLVNGVTQIGASPNPPGITIPSIAIGATVTIRFTVRTGTTIPEPSRVTNVSSASYSTFTFNSNTVITTISNATLLPIKTANRSFANVGDLIVYTVTIRNSGNTSANNVMFIDTIPNGTSFNTNSFVLNGLTQIGANPNSPGVNIGIIPAGRTFTVTFSVNVTTIPTPNPIPNSANVSFSYIVGPSTLTSTIGGANSNIVNTQVNNARLQLSKSSSRNFANVGDNLIYSITITNTGSTSANNVIFIDTIPNGTNFVTNSFMVNGLTQIGANPNSPGVNIGTIPAGSTFTVSFSVNVVTIPVPNPIPNSANVNFSYIVDPSIGTTSIGSANSNIVNTRVNNANLSNISKSVNRSFANIGNSLTYSITITNSGNTSANNVIFIDTIPNGTNFITNSFMINGITQIGANPNSPGVNIGTIPGGSTFTVSFSVNVVTIPVPNPIPNSANVSFSYIVDTSIGTTSTGNANSNVVNTRVNNANLSNISKSVNRNFANIGDNLIYTITIINSGSTSANNVIFIDTIPNGTNFISNSFMVNGVNQIGANPNSPGVNIGTIPAGSTFTISFSVNITTTPVPNPIPNSANVSFSYIVDPSIGTTSIGNANSNIVNTRVNNANLNNISKSVNRNFANVGDNLIYTITITNSGSTSANNVIFIDTIPNGTNFVSDSFTVNGITQIGVNPNSPGVNIGTILAGSTFTVAFSVAVVTIPIPNPIPNSANVSFSYIIDPSIGTTTIGNVNSNIVNTRVNNANLDNISKSVNRNFANIGNILIYSITITNTGSTSANNVIFIDTIPNGTNFITNSFMINGITQIGANPNPPGVNIGIIPAGATFTVSFSINIVTIPVPNPIPNSANVSFSYVVNPSIGATSIGNSNSNIVNTQVNNATLQAVKSADKDFVNIEEDITYSIGITNLGSTSADNVIFIDTIPNGTHLETNGFMIDGVTQIGSNPNPPGVNIGTIPAGSTVTVSFTVHVVTIPVPNPIPNSANISFSYIVDPSIGTTSIGSTNSNTINTQVNNNRVQASKSVDKSFADIGDSLIYSITITNIGNVSANSVMFIDTIANGTNFVNNSFMVNGVTKPGQNPNPPGVNIGTIPAGGLFTVSFIVNIVTIPVPNPILNSANLRYSYIVNPSIGTTSIGNANSNTVSTQVSHARIQLTKSVDNNIANIGDNLIYSITISNTGSTSANNVILIDTIPNGTNFIIDSFMVNGISQIGLSPDTPGVNIGTIPAGSIFTVSFIVNVVTMPVPNPIPNSANVSFSYIIDPNIGTESIGSANSNIVNTQINNASLHSEKSVNKNFANIGDNLIYSITITNTGNVSANNIILIDTIPNGTNFVSNSFMINGVTKVGANPNPPGINIGTIPAGATFTVSFSVNVITIPDPNPIPNSANLSFSYVVNPSIGTTSIGSSNTNITSTQINNATLQAIKSADKDFVNIEEDITYTIEITNNGSTTANNVIFIDTIPNGTSLENNSFTINGVSQIGANPNPPGVNIGTIPSGETFTVSFIVHVDTVPVPNPIPNSANVRFSYIVDPSVGTTSIGSTNSNIVNTQVNNDRLQASKSVNKSFADIGDSLIYSITITNIGNVSANSVIFIDTIANGTTFINNSFMVNGVTKPGQNPNPPGINIGTIPAGGLFTVSYVVNIVTIPVPNPILNGVNLSYSYIVNPSIGTTSIGNANSNIASTQVNNVSLQAQKSVDKNIADIGDNLIYSITITNSGSTSANNVIFIDTIPNGTNFVSDSFMINGVTQIELNPNPPGINIGTIPAGGVFTISCMVNIVTIPVPNPIPNSANLSFAYIVDPSINTSSIGGANSNTVNTEVNNASLYVEKSSDKNFADIGDNLIYSITITNTGNVSADNVVLIDTIPNGTNFVSDSFMINGVSQIGLNPNPPGVNIGTIPAGTIFTVSFIVSIDTIPVRNPILNSANLNFSYIVDPSIGTATIGSSNSNVTSTRVNNATLEAIKSVDKNFADIGDSLIYSITIANNGSTSADNVVLIDTIPNGTNFVSDSFMINGITQIGLNPNPPGINIGTIPEGSTFTVSFIVNIVTIPIPNPIPNSANISFSYIVNPSIGTTSIGNINTNIVNTQVNNANLQASKSVDKSFSDVGDNLIYSITITNNGSTSADNVILIDTIPNGTNFISDSFMINGITQIGLSPDPPGINIGTIPAGETFTVSFMVNVVTIPVPNPIPNSANISFSYILDPSIGATSIGNVNSNTVNTRINNASLYTEKSVDKNFANIGDNLIYTITIINNGSTSANNVIFIDTISNGTNFISDSFMINGISQIGLNPNPPGINIGTIPEGSTFTVSFMVNVVTIPVPNPIPNGANVSFDYIVDPSIGTTSIGNSNSNIVNTQVNNVTLQAIKSVDKDFVNIEEDITYSIEITNLGSTSAENVIFIDTIPNGTHLEVNGFMIDGVTQIGANPNPPGVNIGTIPEGTTVTVSFTVHVQTIPVPNPIPNSANVSFSYIVDPSIGTTSIGSTNSNIISTQVNDDRLQASKSVNKAFADIGDNLIYSITITNIGNVSANSVIFIDTISNGTNFVNNSFMVNGITQIGVNPNPPGINIGTIPAGGLFTVSYIINIVTIPVPNPILNSANLRYSYIVNPSIGTTSIGNANSNIASTQVNNVSLELEKSVDKVFADIGDNLIYSITITNTGSTSSNSVIFIDTIPNGTNFVSDSFMVNGITQIGLNPNPPGINIGTIPAGGAFTVSFSINIVTIPTPNPIPNGAEVNYSYIIDPNIGTESIGSANSNIVNTTVNNANMQLEKSVDKNFANIGSSLIYSITITNSGSTSANSVIFIDTIPNGTNFVSNSFMINGLSQIGLNPNPPGINLGTIRAGSAVTVSFIVNVVTIPEPNPIENSSSVSFIYTIDPIMQTTTIGSSNSNIVNTRVNNAILEAEKLVNKNVSDIGDSLIYSIIITNIGSTSAENVILIDTIPNGTNFLSDSLVINGVNQIGLNPNPPGVNIGTIPSKAIFTVSFIVNIVTIPEPNPIPNSANLSFAYIVDPSINTSSIGGANSNTVNTKVNHARLESGKLVNKEFADIGDNLVYSITITNTGSAIAYNVIFLDTIPSGTNFVGDSFTVNGITQVGLNPDPPGVNIGLIQAGETFTVSFSVNVATIPIPNPIPNSANLDFIYVIDQTLGTTSIGSANSNIISTQVNNASLLLTKSVNKAFVTLGDILTYTITIINNGNINANNVILTDTIPNGTNFISDSFMVNGVVQIGANPSPPGVNIGSIQSGETITVSFSVNI